VKKKAISENLETVKLAEWRSAATPARAILAGIIK